MSSADPRSRSSHAVFPPFLLISLLLTVQLLPPLPQYFGLATSMSAGTTLAGVIILVTSWLYVVLTKTRPLNATLDFAAVPALLIGIVAALALAHEFIADIIEASDVPRAIQSLVPLTVMLGSSIVLGGQLRQASDDTVDLAARRCTGVFAVILVLAVTRWVPRSDFYVRSAFPFTEASHFALALTPVFMYRAVRSGRRHSLWWLSAGLALGLVFQSLAFLVGCLLTAAVCRRLGIILLGAAAVGAVGLPFQVDYFASRLDFSGSVINLSNLVYVEGWQLAQESLVRSHGWGVGLSQLGVHGTNVPAAVLIRSLLLGEDSNLTDGSFVFAKITSEFGVFGIIIAALCVLGAVRSMTALRSHPERRATTLARCIVVSYLVDLFVRGPGYFVESTMLFATAAAALLIDRQSTLFRHVTALLQRASPSATHRTMHGPF